jgi:hypothetical protein
MLPVEVEEIAKNVSVEKRNEVQTVLNQVFDGVSKMREQLDTVNVIDPNDKVNMKLANTIRLGVRNVRLDAEKTFDKKRQEVQLQMLSYKTEDQLWLKAKQTMQILTKEIEEQARWKEETKQRYDDEQRELKIQQRIVKVSKFAPEMSRYEFEHMSDEGFSLFLSGIEKQYNDRIEAEIKAEQERIAKEKAEQEERERIRKENERLKKEAEEKEKALAIERAKIDAERKASEEKARKEREESEKILLAERKAAQEKLRIEQENARKLALEIETKNKAEQDAKEKAEREAKEKAEQEKARIEAELKKGDSDKVKDLINDLNLLKLKYQFKSQKNAKMYSDVGKLLDKIIIQINQS